MVSELLVNCIHFCIFSVKIMEREYLVSACECVYFCLSLLHCEAQSLTAHSQSGVQYLSGVQKPEPHKKKL